MERQGYRNLTVQELKQYMQEHSEDSYLLVDVRQPKEYLAGHIAGATLIPVGELPARIHELPSERDIVFY